MRAMSKKRNVPAYQVIQSTIRKCIKSGELRPGDTVASERDLARIHEVSLMTARHALASLEREGVVERRWGAGTFVSPPKIHFNKLMSYTELMASRGFLVHSKVVQSSVLDDEYEIANRLSLPAASPLIKVERVRLVAGEPFALETFFLSAKEFKGLTAAPLGRGSLFATLEHEYGVQLAYADEEIDVTAAEPRAAKLLAVPESSPLLRISQLFYSAKGKACMYGWGLYLPGRHMLVIRRFR
jgi:GntR family transcriptional regulator